MRSVGGYAPNVPKPEMSSTAKTASSAQLGYTPGLRSPAGSPTSTTNKQTQRPKNPDFGGFSEVANERLGEHVKSLGEQCLARQAKRKSVLTTVSNVIHHRPNDRRLATDTDTGLYALPHISPENIAAVDFLMGQFGADRVTRDATTPETKAAYCAFYQEGYHIANTAPAGNDPANAIANTAPVGQHDSRAAFYAIQSGVSESAFNAWPPSRQEQFLYQIDFYLAGADKTQADRAAASY